MNNIIEFHKKRRKKFFQKILPIFVIIGMSISIGTLAYTSIVMDLYHHNRVPSIIVEPKL
jgi:hypothetical protein